MNERLVRISSEKKPVKVSSKWQSTGTLTFLFTDIQGSTQLWELYPEQMRVAMTRHDDLIEVAVDQQGGQLVRPRGEGDSRFAVFNRASSALRAAITIQRLLSFEPWTIPSLRMRVGLHSGEADLRNGDFYGAAVNRCARLRSEAHGGQILMSQTTYWLMRDELPPGVSLRDLGEHSLKDLERPEHIYQPVVADLPSDFPPLKTPGKVYNNLPLAFTSFIGREREIVELERLLSQSRLLTITGSGGAGKTRLAIQLAHKILASFPDGVWFINLAPLSNSAHLSQYVMNVLGVREEEGFSPDRTLFDALQSKVILLILDNCEHLMPDVAVLAETILRSAPTVQLLATSHEQLAVPGEIVWRIPSLSSPTNLETPALEDLMQYEAVNLFKERAAAARPDFHISAENAAAVARICAHLDGIPLAIELAASRVRVLSVEEIEARLEDRFRLLVGNRTALPRQRTLRAMVDWSYDLLSPNECILLRRLSVFTSGWTLIAAEEVCSGGMIEAREILDLLTSLIDKSFVIHDTHGSHERYCLLETIQKYGRERLLENDESELLMQKHAAYYLNLAVQSYGKMWGSEQSLWLSILDEDYDDLRSALSWFSRMAGNEENLLRMTGSLWRYWEIRGHFTEGRGWLETALAKNEKSTEFLRANALGGAGVLARQQGDYIRAKVLHEQSLSLFRSMGNALGAARQLNALGEIAQYLGDYANSIEMHEESLSIRHEIGDEEGISVSLRQLGVIARDRGQYKHARELLEESLKITRKLGDKLLMALSLNELGLVTYYLCDYEKSILYIGEAIALQKELNAKLGLSNSFLNLGNVSKDEGDFKRADLMYQESLALKKGLGDKRGITQVIAALAEVAFLQGRYPLAADLAGQSLSQSGELGLKRGVLNACALSGFIAHYQGQYERAALLAEEFMALSKEMEAPRATSYAIVLMALGKYSQGSLEEAREKLQEALAIFKEVNDCRNIAITDVNLARVSYRQGDIPAAQHYLEESLSISEEQNIRWTKGFTLEIMGLLQRKEGNIGRALELFLESLRLSIEQENLQGIANCFGALAGLAVIENQPARAARLFAAAAKLRREMGMRMSNNDWSEYEHYLMTAQQMIDRPSFEAEYSEGFSMTTDQLVDDLKEWSSAYPMDSNQTG